MKKRVIAMLMVTIICITQNAFAGEVICDEAVIGIGGAMEVTEEFKEEALLERQLHAYKYDFEQNEVVSPWSTWASAPVSYHGQELEMSCGPACVKMILDKLTSTTYAESTIRANTSFNAETGTYLRNLVSYLNSQQSSNYYVPNYEAGFTNFANCIYLGIAANEVPVICGLKERTMYGFPYNGTGGHFVIVERVALDKSATMIVDPAAGFLNEPENRSYLVDMDDLHSAYSLINCGVAF